MTLNNKSYVTVWFTCKGGCYVYYWGTGDAFNSKATLDKKYASKTLSYGRNVKLVKFNNGVSASDIEILGYRFFRDSQLAWNAQQMLEQSGYKPWGIKTYSGKVKKQLIKNADGKLQFLSQESKENVYYSETLYFRPGTSGKKDVYVLVRLGFVRSQDVCIAYLNEKNVSIKDAGEQFYAHLFVNGPWKISHEPAGDIVTDGIIHLTSGRGTSLANRPALFTKLNRRYVIAADRKGNITIFAGRLKNGDEKRYLWAMGGIASLYNSAGNTTLEKNYADKHIDSLAAQSGGLNRRTARTAIGKLDKDKLVFITVDSGEQAAQKNCGVTVNELRDILCEIGVKEAVMLDGGRETAIYFNSKVKAQSQSKSNYVYIGAR